MALIEGPEFTFTPGATRGANIYGDWATLMAKIATQPVKRPVITFTESFTIPAGTWNLKGGIFSSRTFVTGTVVVTLPDDAILDNFSGTSKGIVLNGTPSTVHDSFTFSELPPGEPKVIFIELGSAITNTGSVPLVTAISGDFFVLAENQSGMLAIAGPSAPLIHGEAGCTILASAGCVGTSGGYPESWVDGDGTLIYQIGVDFDFDLPLLGGWIGAVNVFKTAKAPNVLYNPQFPVNWPIPTPETVQEALDDLVQRNQGVEVLASLSRPGSYFPNEFVGPFYTTTTDPAIAVFGAGSGFYRATQKGIFTNFCWTNSGPPGSAVDMQIWLAPGGNPTFFAFTGITITMDAGSYITSNTTDALHVDPGDIIVMYNPSLFMGYTSSNLTVTAQFQLELN